MRYKCESQKPNMQESLITEHGSMQMNKKITYNQKQALEMVLGESESSYARVNIADLRHELLTL